MLSSPDGRRQSLQVHPDGEERLDHTVVELLPDPLSLLEDLEPLELPPLAFGLVVQAGVLNSDGRLRRQDEQIRSSSSSNASAPCLSVR